MRVFFTGATGVLGRETVPRLVEADHDVVAVARSSTHESWLNTIGARPVSVDLFNPEAVSEAVASSEVVVHFATAIPPLAQMSRRQAWESNDRLWSEATGNLVDAALAQGVERFVQQSVTFFYADGGNDWLDERSPISPPWDTLESALEAEAHVDRFNQSGRTGVVLRLSRLYGPGPASAEYIEAVAARKLPIVGDGRNYVSSLHSEDAGRAVAASLSAPAGVYNVSDDEPVRSAELAASLAAELGVKAPRRVPVWLARLVVGKAVGLLTTSHRVSHRKFTEATGWEPEHRSIREGWRYTVLGV